MKMKVIDCDAHQAESNLKAMEKGGGKGDLLPGTSSEYLERIRLLNRVIENHPQLRGLASQFRIKLNWRTEAPAQSPAMTSGFGSKAIIPDHDGPGGSNDDRRGGLDLSAAPFNWICYLKSDVPDLGEGTGSLIGERTILTAAHVVAGGQGAVKVWFGREGNSFDVEANAVKIAYPNEYRRPCDAFDFAVILLDKSVGAGDRGYFKNVGIKGDVSWLTDATVNVAGYPVEGPRGAGSDPIMYSDANVVSRVDSRIHHMVDTTAGNSGAPLVYYDKSKKLLQLVGVHTGGTSAENVATLVSGNIRTTILDWSKN